MTTSVNRKYLPAIDHLRAYAALLVIFYHGLQLIGARIAHGSNFDPSRDWLVSRNPFVALIEEGHSGVGLFIVLSGFILSIGVIGTDISYIDFMKARFLRIYPMFLLLTLTSASVYPVSGSALFATIIPFNIKDQISTPFTGMFWAVRVEFDCYFLFPFLIRFSNEGGLRSLARLTAVPLVFCMLAVAIEAPSPRDLSYWTILGRLDQFCIGMMLARLHVRGAMRHVRGWHFVPVALATLLILYAYNHAGGWIADEAWKIFWSPIEALMWSAFIITYLAVADHMPHLMSSVIAKIGTVSYSIYLIHPIVIAVVIDHGIYVKPTGRPYYDALITTALVVIPVTMVLASLTYTAVERPFLRLRSRYAS